MAGFSDADGNFSITVYECSARKKANKVIRTNVQTFFRIEVKQNYSRDVTADSRGASFFSIMTKITEFFTINLYTRTRTVDDKVYYAFMAIAHNSRSHDIVRNYFDRFPLVPPHLQAAFAFDFAKAKAKGSGGMDELYSSKYLAYKD